MKRMGKAERKMVEAVAAKAAADLRKNPDDTMAAVALDEAQKDLANRG